MQDRSRLNTALNYLIAIVWVINGLFCKVLNFVPRHQAIVARILGNEYAFLITKAIGISEIFMAAWIISKIHSRLCAISQILIVAAMNILEFFVAPDLLLFGKINSLIALSFMLVIYLNEFVFFKKDITLQQNV